MLQIADADIGGARVVRTFNMGGKYVKRGDSLTAEQILSINLPNRRALIDSNYIEVYPKAAPVATGERFVVGLGKGQYNVIEGRVLNGEPLNREEAELLLRA